jgi:hypothetical protein
MVNIREEAEKYTLLGLMSFYYIFCAKGDGEEVADWGNSDEVEAGIVEHIKISAFLTKLLEGVELGEVSIYGGKMDYLRTHIKVTEQARRYDWHWEYGEEKPKFRMNGHTVTVNLVWLEMFGLEETRVDPVAVVEWMLQRDDRRALLVNADEASSSAPDAAADLLGEVRLIDADLAELLAPLTPSGKPPSPDSLQKWRKDFPDPLPCRVKGRRKYYILLDVKAWYVRHLEARTRKFKNNLSANTMK